MRNRIFKVEKLVHGGMGIVRDASHAIFVPFSIPGEDIRIRIEGGSKRKIEATLTEVLSASPDRVEPPCPLFGECGGCQLQHISYPAQLKYKNEILAENLAWIAKIRPQLNPFVPSPSHYNYRSRIKMHVRGGRAGFFARRKAKFLPVEYCNIAHDSLNRAIPTLAPLIGEEKPETIEIVREEDFIAAYVKTGRRMKNYRRDSASAGRWAPASGLKFAFQQVNPEQNEALRAMIKANVSDMRPETVIELYAGAGNLTEAILPHSSRVIAVEADEAAVEIGRDKFREMKDERLRFLNMNADVFLESAIKEGMKPDLILLDPPRTGAKEAVDGIMKLAPAHIIYVSCDPATLARDLKSLLSHGYIMQSITPLDMFPQTSHIESVVVLSREV